MSDPKKATNRPRPRSEQVVLRIGPEALAALERLAAEDGLSRELVLPMVYEIVIVPGPGVPQ